jgi:hypothetical protein
VSNEYPSTRLETLRPLVEGTKDGRLTAEERAQILRRLELISHLFDEAFQVPGTKIRLGWDSVIGLIPVVGDGLTTAVSAYFLWEANRLGVRKRTMIAMLGNVTVDFLVGVVPLAGDLIDVAWKANRRNMKLLKKELERRA